MNNNGNNYDQWPDDRYHNYNRNNRGLNHQNDWHQQDQQHWSNHGPDNYHNNRSQDSSFGQHNGGEMGGNRFEDHRGWHQDFPPRHDFNRYDRYQENNNQNRDFEGRYGMPDNYDLNYQHRNGPEYDRGESHYGYTPDNHDNRHNDSIIGAGAVGGSYTSYSASRSRRGHMGHNRSGGMLHREGPGMNSYRRGDINANSNW